MKKHKTLYPPLIFNIFKPARMTSYDVVRHFKRHLPTGFGKIGHFGTLDPFASGVLLIGIAGAARLNDFIHEYLPKTYLAVGKLGVETPTGDLTVPPSQVDDSRYLKEEISRLPKEFIEEKLREKFLGDYWQSPHKYSAAKFEGRALHEWAREGIEIKKEQVLRQVYDIKVVKYQFPYLSVRVRVSSGTYVRTLFSDFANYLGTIGTLVSLVRENVGNEVNFKNALKKKDWPLERNESVMAYGLPVNKVLPFSELVLTERQEKIFKNGGFFKYADFNGPQGHFYWAISQESGKLLGLLYRNDAEIRPKINFNSDEIA
ncbi:MAG TPA: hypothetical protein VKY27_07460 [Bacteriovoracaceae bacterium]|nr:hypothetical protein [Bacteriovoracaceae bacterium]